MRSAIYPEGPSVMRVVAEIGEDPLRDLFGSCGGGDTPVKAYMVHAPVINARALERYREAPHRPVLLETGDFDVIEWMGDAYAG